MDSRIGYDHKGKKYTFNTSGEYFKPLSSSSIKKIFEGKDSNYAAAILYTKLKHDAGYREENRFGTPSIERYDNGIVGYQCINYYTSLAQAKKEFEGYSQLSPKVGTIAYVDTWLAINNDK